jgi:hypothetical protein
VLFIIAVFGFKQEIIGKTATLVLDWIIFPLDVFTFSSVSPQSSGPDITGGFTF